MTEKILNSLKKIGVNTIGELLLFKQREQMVGEKLEDTIKRYIKEVEGGKNSNGN